MKSALLCFTLLLAACAGKPGAQKVRIAVGGVGLQMYNLPITLAEALGYYKEEGVDVELENLGSLPKALQALVGDSADVASLSHFQNIQLAAEGQHTRSFFVCSRRAGVICLAAPSDGKMPPGASEGMKRLIEFTIPSVRDAKIDLSSTWTNDFLPPSE